MKSHPITENQLFKSIMLERWHWRVGILIAALISAIFGILAPYSQKNFIDSLLAGTGATAWIWSTFGFSLGAIAFSQLSNWVATKESLITQKSLADKAYTKILEGPGGFIGRKPAGEGVSLFAVDVPGSAALLDQVIVMAGSLIFPLLLAPIPLQIIFHIPWSLSFSAIAVLTTINYVLARRQSKFFYSFKQLAAERTGLVNEWVQNIRTLRILGWINSMETKIFKTRKRETDNRVAMVTNGQFMNAVASSGTYVLTILAITYIITWHNGNNTKPTAGELLSLLWILGVFLARPLRQFPWVLVIGMDALSSINRLKGALSLPIIQPKVLNATDSNATEPFALQITDLNLVSNGQTLLKNINLSVKKNEFIGIVGEVGSGKSLLLQSIVGSTSAQFKQYILNGKPTEGPISEYVRSQISYVPQEGFTMSASLRENVMFNYISSSTSESSKENDDSILRSLKLAHFFPDKERVSNGLDTEIGERGVNLSGGQRQRISIARAHYAHRPIILLDDCLSAVDVDTEAKLIDKLILEEWKNCTRILATQRMVVLPKCDRILFIENGSIKAEGKFYELYENEPSFREFVRKGEVKVEAKVEEPIDIELKGDEVPHE